MNNLWYKTIGNGSIHLVLLHGWGFNSQIWNCITEKLSLYCTLHLVDLPGFGNSIGFDAMTLDEMASYVLKQVPDKAVWLGWSLGGLVESVIALTNPQRVKALITVASSPCFKAQDSWPGIRPEVLDWFQHHLNYDYQRTIERFLSLQTLRTDTARKDIRKLKNAILTSPIPKLSVLKGGLEILKNADLREPLIKMTKPHLRIYGDLDGLVPRKVVPLLDKIWPNSESLIVPKAAHAPFISHPNEFCQSVINFINRVN